VAPEIKHVRPVQFDPGSTATLTVTGRNFASDAADVRVYLRMSAGGEAPCLIEDPVSETQIVCTLPLKPGRKHDGVLVVSVGSEWSGGAQNSSVGVHSKIKEFDPPAPVTVTISKDIADIPRGTPQEYEFIASFTSDVSNAVGISRERIKVTSIRPGSVIVEFSVLPDVDSVTSLTPASVAASIVKQASDPSVRNCHLRVYVCLGTASLSCLKIRAMRPVM
jgi:hypothetical protein